jgi:hypothetical protein
MPIMGLGRGGENVHHGIARRRPLSMLAEDEPRSEPHWNDLLWHELAQADDEPGFDDAGFDDDFEASD